MSKIFPYTFEEALKKLGSNFDNSKLLDHIANGDLIACFRYDGILGYLDSFISFFHTQLTSDKLAEEIIGSFEFHGWLTIEVGSEEVNHLLYTPNTNYKVCYSSNITPCSKELSRFDFVLLDTDPELYFFDKTITAANLLFKTIYLKDLRIIPESLHTFIEKNLLQEDKYSELLKRYEELQEKHTQLQNDLISAKSKKSYNQLIYLLCNYPHIIDLNERPYTNYNKLIGYFDKQGIDVPTPSDDTTKKILSLAKEEFDFYSPK